MVIAIFAIFVSESINCFLEIVFVHLYALRAVFCLWLFLVNNSSSI